MGTKFVIEKLRKFLSVRKKRARERVDTACVQSPASFPVVLGDFGCDVTCQACREKPPLVTRIARRGLGTRLYNRPNPSEKIGTGAGGGGGGGGRVVAMNVQKLV